MAIHCFITGKISHPFQIKISKNDNTYGTFTVASEYVLHGKRYIEYVSCRIFSKEKLTSSVIQYLTKERLVNITGEQTFFIDKNGIKKYSVTVHNIDFINTSSPIFNERRVEPTQEEIDTTEAPVLVTLQNVVDAVQEAEVVNSES